MKRKLLLIPVLALSSVVFSQEIMALSGVNTQQINFSDFRSLDFTGAGSDKIIFGKNDVANVISQTLKQKVSEDKSSDHNSQTPSIATLAFDQKNNNLVYMPMFSSNIYVLNQTDKTVSLVENTVAKPTRCDIGSQFTRMTVGADGSIYALTNSGSQLIQISKSNGKNSVRDLGSVRDDSSNGENSFLKMEKAFGGDMVADADNNFYVFSAAGNVFKLDSKFLTAKFMGKISGLPERYSLNGAAVNSDGKVVVAGAKAEGFYVVDLKQLSAEKMDRSATLPVYDLASSFLVNDNRSSVVALNETDIYPTNIKEDYFNLSLSSKVKSNVTVEVFDLSGVKVLDKSVTSEMNVHQINLNNLKAGVYLVSVKNQSGKSILSKKILVE